MTAALPPGAVVRPYGVNLDGVEHPTALVVVTAVDPPSVACLSDLVHLDVVLVSHLREPGTADDDLEDLLDATLLEVGKLPNVNRGTAERVAYLNTWPAYRIPLEVAT